MEDGVLTPKSCDMPRLSEARGKSCGLFIFWEELQAPLLLFTVIVTHTTSPQVCPHMSKYVHLHCRNKFSQVARSEVGSTDSESSKSFTSLPSKKDRWPIKVYIVK